MKYRLIPFIITLICCFYSNFSLAYSEKGHQIIAEIASQCIDPATKEHVLKYLSGTSFEDAALWMDQVRRDHSFDNMKPWHYINIEKGQKYVPQENENIVNVLEKILNELDSKEMLTNQQIKTDLLVLFHLLGDLHQPLHVGYGADRGGNEFQVNYKGKGSNLHKIWDDVIIQDQNVNLEDCMNLFRSMSKSEMQPISKINIIDWMNDSRNLLDQVYGFNGHILDEQYMQRMKPIVEKRLVYAGIRLGAILDKYFKDYTKNNDSELISSKSENQIISANQTSQHVGENITVCDMVYGGKALKSLTLINVGASYPENPFTIVIRKNIQLTYEPIEFLKDKKVCFTGNIILYKNKPEIVISNEDQIRLQD